MKNNIQIFKNESFGEIRVAGTSEEPLFCAKDVAIALGYSDTADAIQRHCKSGKKVFRPHSNGIGGVNMVYIPEKDVYRLIMRSNLPDAEKFQDWVCEEVLPSIRKHGIYATDVTIEKLLADPDFKAIPNYSRYAVDIFGNIYSLNYNKTKNIKIMKQRKNRYGYMQIQLFDDSKKSKLLSVHRLVAISFIPFIKGKEYVNHIDGNKSNNHVDNLEWCNLSENTKHSYNTIKTQSYNRLLVISKEAAKRLRKFTQEEVDSIRKKHSIQQLSFRKLAKEYNCGKTVIERIVNHVTYAD